MKILSINVPDSIYIFYTYLDNYIFATISTFKLSNLQLIQKVPACNLSLTHSNMT